MRPPLEHAHHATDTHRETTVTDQTTLDATSLTGPTTLVPGPLRRSVGYDSFTHLTDAQVLSITDRGVEFAGELDPDTIAAISAFITSTSDEDQAARAALRDAAAKGALNLAKMLCAYTLGDDLPAARYPCTRECETCAAPAQ